MNEPDRRLQADFMETLAESSSSRLVRRRNQGGRFLRRCSGLLLVYLFPIALQLRADVLISETTSAEVGGHKIEGQRIVMIKGMKLRVETRQGKADRVMIYNIESQQQITLDSEKRQAKVKKLASLEQAAERKVPSRSVKSSLTATGEHDQVLEKPCVLYDFSIRVPVNGGSDPTLVMTGTTCIGKNLPGLKEYGDFATAAKKSGLILGFTSENMVFVAFAHAQTELYRIIAEQGVPLKVQTATHFDGGFLAGLLNKTFSGSRNDQVVAISLDPLPSENFSIPQGWKSSE